MKHAPIRAAEFFAGIGLVREALQPLGVKVVWANDIEKAKYDAYAANHSDAAEHFHLGDVREVQASELPQGLELATSSFPCVDLSLAGNRLGLVGSQSGMFWEFARVVEEMGAARPSVIMLENVRGFATSHGGKDIAEALERLSKLDYSLDVLAIDARHFVPQSRPRMFIVGIRMGDLPKGASLGVPPVSDVRPPWAQAIHKRHHQNVNMHHLHLPRLPQGPEHLTGIVEAMDEDDRRWWHPDRVDAVVNSLSDVQRSHFEALLAPTATSYRTAYRRTRNGVSVWELRKDSIAGCLRTTGGGSSRQALVKLGRRKVQIRWMTPFEYAGLMGAGSYKLTGSQNQQLFGFGDAVVVDVVRWIGEHYLIPVLRSETQPISE